MTNELLPCPFCGQEVKIEAYASLDGKQIGHHIFHVCHLTEYGMVYMASRGTTDSDREELIAAWNTRASLTDECSGCVHCHKGADWETCQSCARNWGDKYEVAQ